MDASPRDPWRAEHAWLLRLAEALVGDPHQAQDLAQETWIRLFAAGRRPTAASRPWMAGVARNLALHLFRSQRRRRRHETRAARAALAPEPWAPEERLEWARLRSELVEAVADLREPFRTTVVLRYLEDSSVEEVARRQGVPVNTVRSRLVRALAMLRSRLARDDRRARVLASPGWDAPRQACWPRGLRVLQSAVLVGGLAGAVFLGIVTLGRGAPGPRVQPSGGAAARETGPTPPFVAPSPLGRRPMRAPSSEDLRPGVWVRDVDGAPVAGVRVVARPWTSRTDDGPTIPLAELLEAGAALGVSDDQGFVAGLPEEQGLLAVADSPPWTTVHAPRLDVEGTRPPTVIVTPCIGVWGEVVDQRSAAIEGVRIRQRFPEEPALSVAAGGRWILRETTSHADGRFALDGLSYLEGSGLVFEAPGYEPLELSLEEIPPPETGRFVLQRTTPLTGPADGRVLDETGRPLAGARVGAGDALATTDANGRFAFEPRRPDLRPLWVAARGRAPVRVDVARGSDLVLDRPGARLEGLVLDPVGGPWEGIRVVLADPTVIAVCGHVAYTAERTTAGTSAELPEVETDARGRFRFGSLDHRPYRLWLVDPATSWIWEAGPFSPGDGVEHRIPSPADTRIDTVEGRLLGSDRAPLAGVPVFALSHAAAYDTSPPNANLEVFARSPEAVTGEDGRFLLRRVPLTALLYVVHPELGALTRPVARFAEEGGELVLDARIPVLVQVKDERADAFEFLDDAGERLEVHERWGGSLTPRRRVELGALSQRECHTPVRARTLVLLSDGLPIAECALDLREPCVLEVPP